jgi:nucleotide-binding universal stress UspA family protein
MYDGREIETAARNYGEKQLSMLQAKAQSAGVRATTLVVPGLAAQQIIRAARSKKADLIVIGTHGRTGLARLFLGSVAARVVAGATCPVLTVRGR